MNNIFLDTNLLVYLTTAGTAKCKAAAKIINKCQNAFISVQVLNEFASVCFRKKLLPFDKIQQYIWEYTMCFDVVTVDFLTISKAFDIKKNYNYSYYDCVIIASALQSECSILYTEDLQHKQIIEKKLTIINPFL